MKSFRLGLITILTALIVSTVGAYAARGQVTTTTPLYAGPDATQVIGQMDAGVAIEVGECAAGYCRVQGQRGPSGWIASGTFVIIDQPQPQPQPQPHPQPIPLPGPIFPWPQPQPQPQPLPQPQPQPQPPVFEEAGACFYSERNYGGSSFCLEEGDSYNRLRNWDDRIRSVEVFGGAYVDLCADRNFNGACVTLTSNTRRLPTQLDRKASSLEVY